MAGTVSTGIDWLPGKQMSLNICALLIRIFLEYDTLLRKIASTDEVECGFHTFIANLVTNKRSTSSEWEQLRDIIKCKIQQVDRSVFLCVKICSDFYQNISLFLTIQPPPPPPPFFPMQTGNGGLKLPPFPPRAQLHLPKPPICYMDEEQANKLKESIFQLLDQFEG